MPKIHLPLKSVIFDMDGVITNTMPDHFKAWQSIFKEEGIHVSHYDVYSREGQPGMDTVRELFARNEKPFSIRSARNILSRKEDFFKKIVRIRFIPGIKGFLKRLSRENFRLGLVTGTSRHEVHRILPQEMFSLFEVIVTGSDVRNGKPHPEPYEQAMAKLQINPLETIVFENAPFGIRSAKSAGLRCVALETSLPRKYLNEADYIFKSISDACAKIHFEKE